MKDIHKLFNPLFVLWLIIRYHPFAPLEYYLKWKSWNNLSDLEKDDKNWDTFDCYLYYNPMSCDCLIFCILFIVCFALTAISFFGWMFISEKQSCIVVTSIFVGFIFYGLTVFFYERIKLSMED